jgi:kynurenine 3-monooxygenase
LSRFAPYHRRISGHWFEAGLASDLCVPAETTLPAIAYLSDTNYDEMSQQVLETSFSLKRDIETALQRRFPDRFLPLYAMIAFSTQPYAEVLTKSRLQDEIVAHFANDLTYVGGLDLDAADRLLPPATGR